MQFCSIDPYVKRLLVPFDYLYTSVYLFETSNGVILYDCADLAGAEKYLLPALKEEGVDVKTIVVSHDHGDHSGGLPAVLRAYPKACVLAGKSELYCEGLPAGETVRVERQLTDGERLADDVFAMALPGHTQDCFALFDRRTGTIFTVDAVQAGGVLPKYPTYAEKPNEYLSSLEKVRDCGAKRLIAAHDYFPCGDRADGEKEIDEYLNISLRLFKEKYQK